MIEMEICRNPNYELFEEITQAVISNNGYCCCELEHTPDTKCMCKNFKEQAAPGLCHCGRFIKVPAGKVITLSGSTKFKDDFERVARELTLQGHVVMMPNVFTHADNLTTSEDEKVLLDGVHLKKIMMSDTLYVINKGGYIGESTKNEIEFALMCGLEIIYMEDNKNE